MEYTDFLNKLDESYPEPIEGEHVYLSLSRKKTQYIEELKSLGKGVAAVIANARKGNKDALLNLALCNQFGIGMEQDLDKAIKIYTILSDHGYKDAYYYLAAMICHDRIYSRYSEALTLYRKADELGDLDATFSLYHWYHYGLYTEQNDDLALKYLSKAMQGAHVSGMREYGKYELFGVYGLEKNIDHGLMLIHKAIKHGDTNAQKMLDVFESEVKAREKEDEKRRKEEERAFEQKKRKRAKDSLRWERILRGKATKKDLEIQENEVMTDEDKDAYELIRLKIENEKAIAQYEKEVESIVVEEDENVDIKIAEYEALINEFGGLSDEEFLASLEDEKVGVNEDEEEVDNDAASEAAPTEELAVEEVEKDDMAMLDEEFGDYDFSDLDDIITDENDDIDTSDLPDDDDDIATSDIPNDDE